MRRLVAIAIGLALCAYAAGAGADEVRVLPQGSRCEVAADDDPELIVDAIDLDRAAFLASRSVVDHCNTASARYHELAAEMPRCAAALRRATEPEPRWQVAARWVTIGAAVGAAFGLGLWVGAM